MLSFPHPTIPGILVTSPVYFGTTEAVEKMDKCKHQWPEGLPTWSVVDGHNVGMQTCSLCGATRGIYERKENE